MSQQGPSVILYDASGNPLVVADGAAPLSTGGLMVAGYDGANARRLIVKAPSTAAVATDPALVVALSPNNPITVGAASDVTATGALGALNAAVTVTHPGLASVGVQLAAGTLAGTLTFEQSYDGGTTWVAVVARKVDTDFKGSTGWGFINPNPATTIAFVGNAGAGASRVRVSAYTSGTANATVRASSIVDAQTLFSAGAGLAAPPSVAQIGGSDGSTLVAARFKAASTAAVAADPALVVTVSPNSAPLSVTTVPSTTAPGIAFGDVSLAASAFAAIRRTAYTEQTTNAQRSIVSASANDAAAGTGARTVRITYLDQTGAGPFTETVTLNGTTPVNTVSTTICFVEEIEVMTAGSTGSNVGILTLKAATAGGGATIGTVGATDNRNIWAHHYVPTGKTCYVTGTLIGSDASVAGNGSVYVLKALTIGGSVDVQISDFMTLYGQSSQVARNYASYIKVAGPARITMYVKPNSASSNVFRGSFDYYDA